MAQKESNPFIVIEALDAGGSQTQTDLLSARLKRRHYQVLQLHFPQEDRATGRLIYDKFLLHKNKRPFSRREQALLYIQDFYARVEDITAVTTQTSGRDVVISDRYCSSTFAYQTMGLTGAAWQRMYEWLWWLCFADTPALPKPDLIIFLDTPVEVSLKRLAKKKKDFFETKAKLAAIRSSYLKVAKKQKWVVIPSVNDAGEERTREDLHEAVWQHVAPLVRS